MTAVTKTARVPKLKRTVDKKCSWKYQNWDQVVGYADSGESVPVYDKKGDRMSGSKYGCPKYCTCRTKRSGKMKLDCKKEPCIAF